VRHLGLDDQLARDCLLEGFGRAPAEEELRQPLQWRGLWGHVALRLLFAVVLVRVARRGLVLVHLVLVLVVTVEVDLVEPVG
jgi:hypothetical protein